jgi:hypothetical protein
MAYNGQQVDTAQALVVARPTDTMHTWSMRVLQQKSVKSPANHHGAVTLHCSS